MDDICTACLCTGRNLYFIGETGHYHLYSQILNEIPVYDFSDVCVRVCWECRAVLRRFGDFKALVKRSYSKLLLQLHHNVPPDKQSLIRSPQLKIQKVIQISHPIIEVKEEDLLSDHNYISGTDAQIVEQPDTQVKDEDVLGDHNYISERTVHEVKIKNRCNNNSLYNEIVEETRKSKKVSKDKMKKVSKKKKKLCQNVNQKEAKKQHTSESLNVQSTGEVTVTGNDDRFTMVMCCDSKEDMDAEFNMINSDTDNVDCNVTEIDDTKNPLNKSNSIQKNHTTSPDDAVNHDKVIEDHEYALKSTRNKILESLTDSEVLVGEASRTARKSKKVKVKKMKLQPVPKKIKEDIKKILEDAIKSNNEDISDCDNICDEKDIEQNIPEYNVINSDNNINSNIKEKGVILVKDLRDNIKGISIDGKTKCHECGKMFSSKKTFRYHLNTIHKGQNCFPCPRCGKVYQWKSNLGRHLRTHKALDKGELHCAPCDKWFASVATYRQHLRTSRTHVREDDYSFSCAECGKRFLDKRRLREHVDWEHLQQIRFRCTLCQKAYKSQTSLYVHMQNLHRDKKKDNLCHICGKSYQNAAKLKYHIVAMHTSETPYSCAQCGAAFGWYSSLYRHTREVHHKIKLQPKKSRKQKRGEMLPPMLPAEMMLPQHPGPA